MLEWLFDTRHFVTRDHCGNFTPALIALNQLANFLIFLAYMSIPLSLFSYWRVLRKYPEVRKMLNDRTWMVMMFCVFILSCGFTHLMDVLAFVWAPYRFFTLLDVVTALASLPTALLLPGFIKEFLHAAKKGQ